MNGEKHLRQYIKEQINEYGGMSPSMRRKSDPEFHLKRALKKWNMDDLLDTVTEVWNYRSPGSAKSLENMVVDALGWEDADVPGHETFVDIYKACVKDEKAASRRNSYEF